MAIARISGNILQDDLQRGSNLSIQGNLVYFDVTNNRVGVLTSSPDVEFTVNGSANITANVDTGNLISSGIVSATGNVSGLNFLGNVVGQAFTNSNDITITSDGNVEILADNDNGAWGFLIGADGEILVSGANLATVGDCNLFSSGRVTALGNITGANLNTVGQVVATGNVTGGNLTTAGDVTTATVTATGNVSSGNLISTGTMETGTATFTGLATFQNDSDYGVFVDQDGLILRNNGANIYDISVGPSGGSINALADKSFAITTDNNNYAWTFYDDGILDAPGNVEAGGNVIALGNVSGVNLNTSGQVVATGNITGGNIISSGSVETANVTISGTSVTSDANLSIATSSNGNVDFDIDGSGVVSFNTTTSLTIPVGNTAQRPGSPETGALRFNTTITKAEVYNGSDWVSVGETTAVTSDEFDGDGSTIAFTLSDTATTDTVFVVVNGTVQEAGAAYNVSGTTLTFTEAPANGDRIQARSFFTAQSVSLASSVLQDADNDTKIQVEKTADEDTIRFDIAASEVANITANGLNVTGNVSTNILSTKEVYETLSTKSSATGTVVHDLSTGHIFYHTSISANFTANFTNIDTTANAATTATLILVQGSTAYIPTAVQISGSGQTVNWQGGSQPTGTNNGIDVVTFSILDVGGNYTVLGQLTDF